MNKIYKVMYSKVKQCAVVVSEIAKSHGHNGESSGVRRHAALTAAVLVALGSLSFTTAFVPMTTEAADKTRTDGSNFVGVERTNGLLDESKYENSGGKGAQGADSITIGLKAQAGAGTITIGDRNAGASLGSVYVGQGDIAKPKLDTGGWATSIGYNSDATGYGSIALGSNAVAKNSYAQDSKGESLVYQQTVVENGEQKVRLVTKPDIQRASVAIGYGASADNGNIAIGSYSDASTDLRTAEDDVAKAYLTESKADSYVSVGKSDALRRISNVADGASASDVATVGQLKALSKELGGYKPGFGIQIDPDSTDKTKNTISLNRNLGTNLDKTGHVYLDVSKTGLVLGTVVDGAQGTDTDLHYGATGDYAVTVGGGANTASGKASVVLGGSLNKASNEATVASGGYSNVASGSMAAVYGGSYNEASGTDATILGGTQNKASNTWTAVGGGALNEASGKYASVWGGYYNKATDDSAAVYGGLGNSAYGSYSAILGGGSNKAGGAAVVSGGASNEAAGLESAVLGGVGNIVTGANATAVGGFKGSVNGVDSVGILGGSTGINAPLTLAAGYQSTVTDTGVTSTPITEEEAEKFQEEGTHPGLLVGSNDPDNPTFKILDHFATAVGYQATADEAQTVAFGHDKGDTYYGTTTYTWKQKATVKDGHYYDEYNQEISKESYESLKNADGTWNDYSQPIATVEEKKYDSAYYNRLVKAADGVEDHDAVVMEQLKNASNVGQNIKVYKTDKNGNVQFDESNNPIEDTSDSDDVKTRREAAQKASEDAWGKAIGTGKIADPTKSDTNDPEANGSQQLVTGGTVYTEVRPATDGTYVKTKNTTALNLTALDKQVAANTTKLGDKNHNIKYYSVEDKISDDKLLPSISGYSNEKNDGAKGAGSMAAGFNTHADGIASTVAGSYSGVVGTGLQGAAALSYGTFNVNQNAAQAGTFSGVANSIVGQANVTTDSNAAIIYGAGNTVKNSYRDIDTKNASEIMAAAGSGDVTKLGEALQKAVPTSGGQVMVMGGGNNVESAYMTQVVGVGNTVKGNQVYTKDEKTGEWNWTTDTTDETAIKDYNPEKSSQYNYVDGFRNEVINGKHDYVIGANNKLDGDSYDDNNAKPIKRSNKSNVVIGDNHALTGKKDNVIIGSADTEGTLTRASDAVIIGHNANATSDTGADNAVAIGRAAKATGGNAVTIGVNTSAGENSITIGSESHANSGSNIAIGRSAQVYGYEITNAVALGQKAEAHVADGVAIGSGSIATVAGNSVEGYDPTTGQYSTDGTAIWKATKAAVSIGTADGKVTRQINGVAAGTNDTDAVNVAQLKKLEGMKANVDASNIGKNLKGADGKTAAADAEKTANEKAWGAALGTGDIATPKDMLVTDKAIHDELRPATDGTYVKGSQTTAENLSKLDAQVKTNADDISTNTTNITKNAGDITKLTNLSNITNEGQKVIKNLSKDAVKVTAGDRVTVTSTENKEAGTITYKVSANNDGTVAAGDQNLVSGDTVNTAITNAINNAGTATDTKLAGKANVDASNIGKNLKGADGKTAAADAEKTANEKAWGAALGTGDIATPKDMLVTDKAIHDELRPATDGTYVKGSQTTAENLSKLDAQVKTNADDISTNTTNITKNAGDITKLTNLSNITNEGQKVIKNLSKDAVKVTAGDRVTVTSTEDKEAGTITYKVSANNDGKVAAGDQNLVSGDTVNTAITNAITNAGTATDTKLAGKANVDASNIGANLKGADGKAASAEAQKANAEKWGSAIGTGEIKADDGRMVTGKTVYDEVRPKVDGSYVKKDKTTGENLSALDSKIGSMDKDGNYIKKDDSISENLSTLDTQVKKNADDITNINQSISTLDQNAVKYDDSNKSKVTLAGKEGTTITNVKDGALSDNSTDAVNGKQLYNEQEARKAADNAITEKVTNNTNEITKIENGEGFTDAGTTVIKNLAKDAVQVKAGTAITVADNVDDKGNKTYTISANNNGTVTKDDGNLISGGTLYNEVHVTTDGSYIKGSQTVGQNLSSLDSGLKTTSDLIHTNTAGDTIQIGGNSTATKIDVNGKDGKGRVITGVVVRDANDPTSAANVGYVNGVTAANTQQIYRDMNNAYGRLNNNINKAAAGSNALAALHPLDYDPDDKADFAVGYGHYRNANAAAVGAFYHPNENTMVNVGVSLGNGDPGFNAGVSFKVGRGGAGHEAMSKTEMAKVINSQSKEIDALKKDNADKDKRIDALEQKMAEILAKLDKNGK